MKHFILSILIGISILSACNKGALPKTTNESNLLQCFMKYDSIGYYYYSTYQFKESMDCYINALIILDSIPTSSTADSLYGIVYQKISDLLFECDKYESAKDICFHSLEYSLKSGDSISIASCYRKIGNLCYYLSEKDNPDTLLYYLQKSLPYAKGEDPYFSALYIALVGAYKDKTLPAKFMPERGKGIMLLPDDCDDRLPYLNNYFAWTLWVIEETEQAISYAEQSASSSNLKQQLNALAMLGEMYLEMGDTATSIIKTSQYDSLNLVFSEAKRKASGIEKQLRQYETEKRLQSDEAAAKHPAVTIGCATLVALLITMAVVGFFRKKKAKTMTPSFKELSERFESTEIYQKIEEKCTLEADLTASNLTTSTICLHRNEWKDLEKACGDCFSNSMERFKELHPDLNDGEWQYIMLSLLDLSEVHKAALLGLSYQGCISRRNRVLNKTGMSNLHDEMRNALKNIMET